MNLLKKIPKFLLILVVLLPTSLALAFTDVSSSNLHNEAIEYLQEKGVIQGYSDGTFRPDSPINRAEFLKILLEAKSPGTAIAQNQSNCFPDVANAWYAPYVCYAKSQGIVSGYPDGNFRPANNINLAEALKMVLETYEIEMKFFRTADTKWYEPYYWTAEPNGWLNNINHDINHLVTRGEMAQLIFAIEGSPTLTQSTISVPTIIPHSESGIFDIKSYNEPERIWVKTGDVIDLKNNLKLEVIHVLPDSTRINLYYENSSEKIYAPEGLVTMRRERNFNILPFYSREGTYIYYGDYRNNAEINETELEIYTNPQDLYQKCLSVSTNNPVLCLTEIARYGVVHESYDQRQNGRFSVIYPDEAVEIAQQTLKYLPGCYNSIKEIFGKDQDINKFSIFFYYPEKIGESVFSTSDSIIVPIYEHMFSLVSTENATEPCGISTFPMGHEMTHVFDFGTQNSPLLREGFANYISRKVNSYDTELICEENGYRRNNNNKDELTPYDIEEDPYNVGECYFKRLEETYGISKVNDLIQYLGTTRNKKTNGEVYFFDDVINPILGIGAQEIAVKMGIDTTCHYAVPFEGYLCDSTPLPPPLLHP